MTSPYDNNVGSNWGPPSGLSAMLAAQTQQGMEGMQNGAKMFDAAAAQFKQRQDEGKAADYLFKAHPEYLEQLGIHPEQFKTMGSVDKSRAAAAVMNENAMKDMMAKRADVQSQTNERNSISDWRTAQAGRINDEDSASQAMMEHLASMGRGDGPSPDVWKPADQVSASENTFNAPTGPKWSPEAQAILESGAAMGRSNPKVSSTILKEVLPQIMGEGSTKRSQFFDSKTVAEDVPGMPNYKRVVTGPNTSTLQYMGTDVGQPVPQHDDDGNLIGYSVRDAKGHSVFKAAPKGTEPITAATDADGNPLPGYYRMGNKVVDTRSAMEKKFGTAWTKGAAPAADDTGAASKAAPKVGEVRSGYKFKGGDPKNPKSWEKQ